MSSKKIITVFGATGAAGGSVAKYLLDDGTFAVRAVTRNVNSAAAQALKAKGAEVVSADLDKPETLPAALEGAYGVSALTDFWAPFQKNGNSELSLQIEAAQGKAIVDAAKAAGVQHFLLFTLPNSDVPHFKSKYIIDEHLKASGVPRTSFYNAFYYENLVGNMGLLSKQDDGKILLNIPIFADAYLPSYSVEQTGAWVLAAFKNPTKWIGKDLIALGEHVTPNQYAAVLSKAFGKEVVAKPISREEFASLEHSPNPLIVELFLNMRYFLNYTQPPNGVYDQQNPKAAFDGGYTFEQFVEKNDSFRKQFLDKFA